MGKNKNYLLKYIFYPLLCLNFIFQSSSSYGIHKYFWTVQSYPV